MKKILSVFLAFFILNSVVTPAMAQDDSGWRMEQDLILVGGAGAAGAILGLSTLSFVEKPSKHLSNIWTGAALGVIAGVLFVAYTSATRGSQELDASAEFNSYERLAWHDQNTQNLTMPKAQFGTQFWTLNF